MKHYVRLAILFITVVVNATFAAANDKPALSEVIRHSTVRIETKKKDGGHVGTGFFYMFSNNIPALVTCRHVIQGASQGRLFLSLVESGKPLQRIIPILPMDIPNAEKAFISHPDPKVDLAIFLLGPLMNRLETQGKQIDFFPLTAERIPNQETLKKLGSFADIKIVGYPIGIWDSINNRPILRRGISATDPLVDYNGSPYFLIDAAVFPGSSGSPVLVANEGLYSFAGTGYMGTQLYFLGILFATPEYSKKGKVEIKTIPTSFELETTTMMPTNLGLVVKASQLNGFEPVLQRFNQSNDSVSKTIVNDKK